MKIDNAEAGFIARLEQRGLSIDEPDIDSLVEAMLDWYAYERVQDAAAIDEDGDMLLLQWGWYDWGSGRSFEYGLTRQFVGLDDEDDPSIIQLTIGFRFAESERTTSIGSGQRWCQTPAGVEALRHFLQTDEASVFARSELPTASELATENVG